MDPLSHPLWDVGNQLNPAALLIRTVANLVAVRVPLVSTLVKTGAATLAEVAEPEEVLEAEAPVASEGALVANAQAPVANEGALVANEAALMANEAPAYFCADSYRYRNRRRKNRHRLKR